MSNKITNDKGLTYKDIRKFIFDSINVGGVLDFKGGPKFHVDETPSERDAERKLFADVLFDKKHALKIPFISWRNDFIQPAFQYKDGLAEVVCVYELYNQLCAIKSGAVMIGWKGGNFVANEDRLFRKSIEDLGENFVVVEAEFVKNEGEHGYSYDFVLTTKEIEYEQDPEQIKRLLKQI